MVQLLWHELPIGWSFHTTIFILLTSENEFFGIGVSIHNVLGRAGMHKKLHVHPCTYGRFVLGGGGGGVAHCW